MIDPLKALEKARRVGPLLRAYSVQIALAIVGIALLGAALSLGDSGIIGRGVADALAIGGLFGVGAGAMQARAKNTAHLLLEHLREKLYAELVVDAATSLPK